MSSLLMILVLCASAVPQSPKSEGPQASAHVVPVVIGRGVGLFEPGPLLVRDDFDNLDDWVIQIEERTGFPEPRVLANENTLSCLVPGRGCTVWLRHKFTEPIAITYEVLCPSTGSASRGLQVRDINNFWMASDPEDPDQGLFDARRYTGRFGTYDKMHGYYASTGGGGAVANKTTRMRRYPRAVEGKPVAHIALDDKDGKSQYLITPDKWITVQLVAYEGLVQYVVDGKLVYEIAPGDRVQLEARDPAGKRVQRESDYDPGRYPAYREGYFGFRMVGTHHVYRRFRAYALEPANFVHPGISHSRAELDVVRARLKSEDQPWQAAWQRMLSSPHADLARVPKPRAHVERGAYNRPNIGASDFLEDGRAAYTCALMWVFTGEDAYAAKSRELLGAWATTLESVANHDARLLIGMGGLQYCNAAELLKHVWQQWPDEDQRAFERMLRQVFYPVIRDFFPRANGNWDAAMIQTMMAMGVFLDDRKMFHRAVDYYVGGAGNGAVHHYFHPSGQCQESGRDQGHTQMGLEYLINSAEIAWQQRLDIYRAYDDRLAKGFEYTAKYNLGHEVPFEYFESYQGKYKHKRIADKGRGRLRAMYEKAYRHYHHRRGLEMPWCREAVQKTRPESGATMPWSTLMFGR